MARKLQAGYTTRRMAAPRSTDPGPASGGSLR